MAYWLDGWIVHRILVELNMLRGVAGGIWYEGICIDESEGE